MRGERGGRGLCCVPLTLLSIFMSLSLSQQAQHFQSAVSAGDLVVANRLLQSLKATLLELDSLPPLSLPTPNSREEISLARDIYEHAVLLSIRNEDRNSFQNYLSLLKPYRFGLRLVDAYAYPHNLSPPLQDSPLANVITGLHLLYLLVENQLSDFHSELELLTQEQHSHPAIFFCTQLDHYLMIGSYDQVMEAASNPPIEYFSFFLTSLFETVRFNIWDCILSSYHSLTLTAATEMLMFSTPSETREFLELKSEGALKISNDIIDLHSQKDVKSEEEMKSHRLIEQSLTYAGELERIV